MIISYGKLRIREKNFIYIILFLTLIMNALSDELGMTTSIRYINDILIFLLVISIMLRSNFIKDIKRFQLNKVFVAMFIFSCINLISVILNLVPINLFIWAIRNTYRFFVFFWACVFYLEKEDLKKIFEALYWLQWINMVLIFYQFTILGLKQDYLGGIFGHGGNAGLLIYSVLILAYAVSKYISKEYSLFRILFILITTCITSVLAEIRVFFVMALIIIFLNFILNKNLLRKMGIILGTIVLLFLAIDIYSELFPYVSLSINALLKEGSSTGGGYNISRLNAFSEINILFFKNNILKNMFGLGFGNCEYSNIPLFCSDFYNKYGRYNYRWFTNQWIFLETGYAGIVSYIFIIILNCIYSVKRYRNCNMENCSLVLVCLIMGIVCVISIFYNSLLKADFGYIAFFSLAISGILFKGEQKACLKK